ncbi:MAG: hypothetical protein ACPLRW_06620 [Moorellales bacterium]
MEVILPGWNVVHTGGGVFVAVRDFPLAGGGAAAVTVTDDSVCLHRKGDGSYVMAEEWLDVLGHLDEVEDEEMGWLSGDGVPMFTEEARDLLGQEALEEIARAMEQMAGL